MVHSVLYYRMNTSLITDQLFDQWCKELVMLQKGNPKEASEAEFSEEFKNFTGETGFHFSDQPWAVEKAQRLLQIAEGRKQSGG